MSERIIKISKKEKIRDKKVCVCVWGGGDEGIETKRSKKKKKLRMKKTHQTEYFTSHPSSAWKEGVFLGENTKLSKTPSNLDINLDLYKQYTVFSSTKFVFA